MCCNKSYQQKFDEKLKERFFNTYTFSNHDKNKFILLLRKGIYSYKYMHDCEKFNETKLPEKRKFLQSLKYGRILLMQISRTDKEFVKILK